MIGIASPAGAMMIDKVITPEAFLFFIGFAFVSTLLLIGLYKIAKTIRDFFN